MFNHITVLFYKLVSNSLIVPMTVKVPYFMRPSVQVQNYLSADNLITGVALRDCFY